MKRCPKCGKPFPDEANFCPTDAGRLVVVESGPVAAPPAMPAGGLVGGRFEMGPAIGGTHTGEIHFATDTQTKSSVALKLVAPAVVALPQVAQRIERELKQLERVSHKAVAKVVASGKHGDRVFVATEMVQNARPLSDLIAASGPVDAQRASDLVLAIGEGLIEAAKVGVVHRDLAPKNVLVTKDALQLINFAVPTPGEKVGGVIEFVAPEVIEGKPVDQRSNIYSLAGIFYFLLTGRAPHIGDPASVAAAHLAGVVEPPSKHAAIPADVDALVVKALDRNPAKRFLTLRQFLDSVDAVSRGPEGGVGATAPLGRVGAAPKQRELAQTLMGFGGVGGNAAAFQQAAKEAREAPAPVAAAPVPEPTPAPPPVVEPAPVAVEPVAAVAPPVMVAAPVVSAPAPAAGSPWAPPRDVSTSAATAPAPTIPESAPAAPSPAAASLRPGTAQVPAGKKQQERPKKDSKGKFRETMWFKKGDLDAQAAEDAAATGDPSAAGKADLLPMEERYADDGSITSTDGARYSLKTGGTASMPALRAGRGEPDPGSSVSEQELVDEMKGGRNVIIIVIAVGILVAIGIVVAFVA